MNPEELIVEKGSVRQAGTIQSGDFIVRVREASERSLYFYAKNILGWKDLTNGLHHPLCNSIQSVTHRQKGYLLPRATFKTTLAMSLVSHMTIQPEAHNIYFPGMYGPDTRILYAAETTDRAETRVLYVRSVYDNNRLLRAMWPHIVWENPNAQHTKWNQQRLLLPRHHEYPECTIERCGVESAITGGHFNAIIKDDLIAEEARNSALVMQRAISWNNSSTSLFDNLATGLEWYFGTRWGAWDLYTEVMEKQPEVIWVTRSIIEDGHIIFPERFTMESLENQRRKDPDLFALNYMNSTAGSSLAYFNMADVRSFIIDGDDVDFSEKEIDAALTAQYSPNSPLPNPLRPPVRAYINMDEDSKTPDRLDPERLRTLRGSHGTGVIFKFT